LKIWNPLYEFVLGWPTYTGIEIAARLTVTGFAENVLARNLRPIGKLLGHTMTRRTFL
jgi:hypothetical protein